MPTTWLWSGRVTESEDANAAALREFNDKAAADPRMDTLLLGAFDGLTMAIKR